MVIYAYFNFECFCRFIMCVFFVVFFGFFSCLFFFLFSRFTNIWWDHFVQVHMLCQDSYIYIHLFILSLIHSFFHYVILSSFYHSIILNSLYSRFLSSIHSMSHLGHTLPSPTSHHNSHLYYRIHIHPFNEKLSSLSSDVSLSASDKSSHTSHH